MALSDVATATPAGFSTSARVALAFGTAPQAGDIILVFIVTDTGHTATIWSASSGGSDLGFVEQDNQTGGAAGSSYLAKIATGTEPATMYINFGGATELGRAYGEIIRGADATTPIISKVYGPAVDSDGLGGSDFLEPPSNVTPSSADDLIYGFFGRDETSSPSAQERDGHTIRANLIQAGNAVLYVTRKQSGTAQTPKIDTTATGEFACFGFAIKAGAATGTQYDDTPSGGPTAAGTVSESVAHVDVASDGPTGAGAASDALGYADAPSGGPSAQGTAAEGLALADAPSGGLEAAGTAPDVLGHADAPTGAVEASGSVVESWQQANTFTDTPSGGPTAAGAVTEALGHADQPAGAADVSGSVVESWQVAGEFTDAPSGGPVAGGTLAESHTHGASPTGGPAASGASGDAHGFTDAPSGAPTLDGSTLDALAYLDAVGAGPEATGTLLDAYVAAYAVTGGPTVGGNVVESNSAAAQATPGADTATVSATGPVAEPAATGSRAALTVTGPSAETHP